MSTRACLIFADSYSNKDEHCLDKFVQNNLDYVEEGVKIYVHSDGYPSGILPHLQAYLQTEGAGSRQDDSSYLSAWFVAHFCTNVLLKHTTARDVGNGSLLDHYKTYKPKVEDINTCKDFFGIGIVNTIETGADYYYVICPADEDGFRIWIYDYNKRYIGNIYHDDDLEEASNEVWWD